jgi:hypothetical protein
MLYRRVLSRKDDIPDATSVSLLNLTDAEIGKYMCCWRCCASCCSCNCSPRSENEHEQVRFEELYKTRPLLHARGGHRFAAYSNSVTLV